MEYVLEIFHERYEIKLVRKPVYKIPETVVRELISNAIIHISYIESAGVRVEIYSDRMTVVSPGALFQGLQKE